VENSLFPGDEIEDHEQTELFRLTLVPGVGPRTFQALLSHFGSATGVARATSRELQAVSGVGDKLARAIVQARTLDPAATRDECQRLGIDLLFQSAEEYPPLLRQIHDPPPVLYVRGALQRQDRAALAIVGSRHATRYGLTQTERLAASLARAGLTIVSGLARGIDTAAHRAALAAGGRTVAVLGSGLSRIYPPENANLANEVARQGALLTEIPLHTQPKPGHFPQRNRLISGMSLGVLVVEAGLVSGALSTAHHANEQGRNVFAVPGPVDSRMSQGCHRLIRDGAKLVENAEDILEELGPLLQTVQPANLARPVQRPAELQLNAEERLVFAAIDNAPRTMDEILSAVALPAPQVLALLSLLELKHLIKRLEGNRLVRR